MSVLAKKKLRWAEYLELKRNRSGSLPATKKTIRVASEILRMNPTLRYSRFFTLKVIKVTAETLRIILAQRLCHMAIKVFRRVFPTAMCKCTISTLFDRQRWLKLARFSNSVTKVVYPAFARRSLNYRWILAIWYQRFYLSQFWMWVLDKVGSSWVCSCHLCSS